MLSQKINLELYKVVKDDHDSAHLLELFESWKNTHQLLLENKGEQELSPIIDQQAVRLMIDLSSQIRFVEKQLNYLSTQQSIDIEALNSNQAVFLVDMNRVVELLEASSSQKLKFIVWIEVLLMFVSILIILLEVIFIFKPSHQRLENALSESKQAKQELEKNLVELKMKNKDLEQFAYVASHDLQEPLRTVTSFTQLLHRKYKDQFEKDGKEEIMFIIDGTRRMKALITGLLKYAKIGKAKTAKSIDCNDLVDQVKRDLKRVLEEKNAKIDVGSLPNIEAYEVEVRQLFQNLITNALKFQKSETQPSIVITSKDLEDRIRFSVQDNGIGISEEYQEQIFMIFKRLHHVNEYEGTGIGLAQCKKIVELHNGEIWVNSKVNEGSTFHFTIPRSLS